jgi:hypothetical protein
MQKVQNLKIEFVPTPPPPKMNFELESVSGNFLPRKKNGINTPFSKKYPSMSRTFLFYA